MRESFGLDLVKTNKTRKLKTFGRKLGRKGKVVNCRIQRIRCDYGSISGNEGWPMWVGSLAWFGTKECKVCFTLNLLGDKRVHNEEGDGRLCDGERAPEMLCPSHRKKEPFISDRRKRRKSDTRTESCTNISVRVSRTYCSFCSILQGRQENVERRGVEAKLLANGRIKLDCDFAFQDVESQKTCL